MGKFGYFSCNPPTICDHTHMEIKPLLTVLDLERDPRVRIKATGACGTVVAVDVEPLDVADDPDSPETIVWVAEDNGNPDWPTSLDISEIEKESH